MIDFSKIDKDELVHRLELAQAALLRRADDEIIELNGMKPPKDATSYDFAVVRYRAGYLMASGYILDIIQDKHVGTNFRGFVSKISQEHCEHCKIFI